MRLLCLENVVKCRQSHIIPSSQTRLYVVLLANADLDQPEQQNSTEETPVESFIGTQSFPAVSISDIASLFGSE
jgi:hypothetical protein